MKAKLARQRGEPVPAAPEPELEAPENGELPPHLLWVWQAFAVCSRTRMVNQAGPQPITLHDIAAYCMLEGIIDEEQRREVLHHLMLLDIEWCRTMYQRIEKGREEAKKKAEADAKKPGKGRRR